MTSLHPTDIEIRGEAYNRVLYSMEIMSGGISDITFTPERMVEILRSAYDRLFEHYCPAPVTGEPLTTEDEGEVGGEEE